MYKDSNVNAALVNDSGPIADGNELLVKHKRKGTTQTLFSGAISASVTEANATVIDMGDNMGGSLEVTINSGTGTFSIATMTHAINTGVFVQMQKEKTDGTGMEDYPAIVTTSAVSKSYSISKIRGRYLKFVPTITGTVNATFKFTPTAE